LAIISQDYLCVGQKTNVLQLSQLVGGIAALLFFAEVLALY